MAPFTNLTIFTGAGGGELASQHLLGWQTVCYVEWDKYAVESLKARIRDGYLHDAPIWDDAFTFDGQPWRGLVDIVSAGFPCQPFSVAGKGLAENDPRNGWPATIRIIREVRPQIAWLENVPGLVSKPYFHTILGELSEAGFDIEWGCLSAAAVGANHKRDRLWILAIHPERVGRPTRARERIQAEQPQAIRSITGDLCEEGINVPNTESSTRNISDVRWEEEIHTDGDGTPSRKMANADSRRCGQFNITSIPKGTEQSTRHSDERRSASWWAAEPELGRVADGVAHRVDRLRAIGNGQVPAVVREAWNTLRSRYTGE